MRLGLGRTRIVELHARRLRKPEHIDVRKTAALRSLDRGQHFVGGPARIGLAVCHAREIGRQLGAEPRAKNRDDDVALRGLRDLRLECRGAL